MNNESEFSCKHIAQLPKIPDRDDLPAYRKCLRKMKPPEFELHDNGGHAELGSFKVVFDSEFVFEWRLFNGNNKRFNFNDLCMDPDLEFERLELGWLIGNIYSLNKIHHLESLDVPCNESMFKERSRLDNWYTKCETRWYKWALATSGKFTLPIKI